MIVDYWLLRRARLNVAELYRWGEGGEYWFSNGYNRQALAAVAAGVFPVLPGFLHAGDDRGRRGGGSGLLRRALRYGVFVAFAISALVYLGLARAQSGAANRRRPRRSEGVELRRHLPDGPAASRIVELTQRAEALGFTHAWTFDSHILWQEPYVIYALMLAATDAIMVARS
jgi:hypothetical protein